MADNREREGERQMGAKALFPIGRLSARVLRCNACTAGRAAFITGQSPMSTGLLKVGLPAATVAQMHR